MQSFVLNSSEASWPCLDSLSRYVSVLGKIDQSRVNPCILKFNTRLTSCKMHFTGLPAPRKLAVFPKIRKYTFMVFPFSDRLFHQQLNSLERPWTSEAGSITPSPCSRTVMSTCGDGRRVPNSKGTAGYLYTRTSCTLVRWTWEVHVRRRRSVHRTTQFFAWRMAGNCSMNCFHVDSTQYIAYFPILDEDIRSLYTSKSCISSKRRK